MKKLIMTGGLGNQMFQYSYLTLLRHHGERVALDTSLYNYTTMHNGYELKRVFGIDERRHDVSWLNTLWIRLLLKIRPSILLTEESLGFETQTIKSRPYIKGEFQSELYFKDIENIIRDVYEFKNIDEQNMKVARKLHLEDSVSVHIRRGDYLNHPLYERICTEDYYYQAVGMVQGRHPDSSFYVFSNDCDWSRGFFEKNFKNVKFEVIDINRGDKSYQDMYLMSQCRHNIIANSSFSWWGAWLNTNPEKMVIAPKVWINAPVEKYINIVPQSWIKI